MTANERQLPMFPLQSVLVPGAPLPLHVFEPRYRALMDAVMRSDPPEFGVVLIERGSEVGGGDVRSRLGTIARVLQAEQFVDGRWGVVGVGSSRIDVAEWLPDDPFPRAAVVDRPEAPWNERSDDLLPEVERAVRGALALKAELGDRVVASTVELDADRPLRAWQLVAIAPISTIDRHRLLGFDEPFARLRALGNLVDEEASVLAHRLKRL